MKNLDVTKKDVIFPEQLPKIILLCGPCRTGTTALSNVFVQAGIESHMQPLKSIRRAKENDEQIPIWQVGNNNKIIHSKETFGLKDKAEFFNPAEILLNLGYPPERLIVIGMLRNPMQTFISWKRLYGESMKEENLLRAFLLTDAIRKFCHKCGIQMIFYVHEAIRNNKPEVVISSLFQKLGINSSSSHLVDWRESPKFGDKDPRNRHLCFYDSPPKKFIEGVRDWGGYQYRNHPVPGTNHLPQDMFKIYELFQKKCETFLNLKIKIL
ncbi:MAG: hypothetical protein U9O55_03435 [Patescibacteria group bacterium]|nr:hypothetical protein [Patescibacteria group bacterium]